MGIAMPDRAVPTAASDTATIGEMANTQTDVAYTASIEESDSRTH